MHSGERPIGAAKGKQSDTEALCQPPPPPLEGGVPVHTPPSDVVCGPALIAQGTAEGGRGRAQGVRG